MKTDDNRAKKILIIEDEITIAEMISDICESFGFETKIVQEGEAAFDAVKAWRPDLITLGLIMPDFSGLEIRELLKDDEETKHIPVLVISALANSETAYKVLKLSQGFLPKPLKMKALEEKIQSALSSLPR